MILKINPFCCLPLKITLLLWGYFISGFSATFLLTLLLEILTKNSSLNYYINANQMTNAYLVLGAFLLTFTITMYLIYHVILVVGLHKNSPRLIKAFYNYITVMLCIKSISTTIIGVHILIDIISSRSGTYNYNWLSSNTFFTIAAIFFVEFYVVIAVHSYLRVLEEKTFMEDIGFEPSAPPSLAKDVESLREYKFHIHAYNPYLVSNNDTV